MAESIRQRVYIETTIPSFYYEVRTEPGMIPPRNWTRDWWDSRRHAYLSVTSAAVIDELQAGAFPNKDQALTLLAEIPLVPVETSIIEIVETYIQRMVMPRDPTGDALHLALASYHKCDFLLMWNVQHLANANKFAHIRRVNALLDLFTPALVRHWNPSPRREMMQDDPAIARIREVRHRISKQFDHDPKKLVEHYMQLQEQHKDRVVGLAKGEDVEEAPN